MAILSRDTHFKIEYAHKDKPDDWFLATKTEFCSEPLANQGLEYYKHRRSLYEDYIFRITRITYITEAQPWEE